MNSTKASINFRALDCRRGMIEIHHSVATINYFISLLPSYVYVLELMGSTTPWSWEHPADSGFGHIVFAYDGSEYTIHNKFMSKISCNKTDLLVFFCKLHASATI